MELPGLLLVQDGRHSVEAVLKNPCSGLELCKSRFAVGGATGSFSGWQRAKEARVSPWTGEPIQRHHTEPIFIGGDPKQRLTPMSVSRHKDLHQDMYRHLEQHTDANGNHMRPLPNNSGADIRLHFPKSQRFDALKRFYDNYPIKYWDARRAFIGIIISETMETLVIKKYTKFIKQIGRYGKISSKNRNGA